MLPHLFHCLYQHFYAHAIVFVLRWGAGIAITMYNICVYVHIHNHAQTELLSAMIIRFRNMRSDLSMNGNTGSSFEIDARLSYDHTFLNVWYCTWWWEAAWDNHWTLKLVSAVIIPFRRYLIILAGGRWHSITIRNWRMSQLLLLFLHGLLLYLLMNSDIGSPLEQDICTNYNLAS